MTRSKLFPSVRWAVILGLAVLVPARLPAADNVVEAAPPAAPETSQEFLFQDVPNPVLFFGDDATDQRMYSTLVETYTLSRFPAWRITFRNTGWKGDKILAVGVRASSRDQEIRRDIESFHPQMVLVNYGMNDAAEGDGPYQGFLTSLNILSRDLPRVGVFRAAFISSNPQEGYEAGVPAGSSRNALLRKYAEAMKERSAIGWQNGVDAVRQHPKGPQLPRSQDGIFIDLLNPMIDLIEAGRKAGVLSPDDASGDKTARLMPDGMHPNWSGHLIMATLILQGLHAPALVSSAALDAAAHSTVSTQGCSVTWQNSIPGAIQFQRQDDALPWPTPPETDLALKIPGFDPATALNRYELKVAGLTSPSYKLFIDDQEVGAYSQADLATGINLGFVRRGPIYDQGQKLLQAVIDKNDAFFNRWRNVQIGAAPAAGAAPADMRQAEAAHAQEVKPELARLDKIIADDERAIHALCQPAPHTFRLEPVMAQ